MPEKKKPDQLRYFVTGLRVPLYEVDLGQGVYHGNYFHLLETAREDFLRHLGYPYRRFMGQELHLTIVEASISYRNSLHYDEEIEVHTAVPWRRSRSLGFSQLIFRISDSHPPALCTRAELTMVCVRFSGQPTPIPKDFSALLDEWMKEKRP